MPYVTLDGPPDIDATHAWVPASGTPPPVINDRVTDPPTLPWVKLLRIDGWGDLPETVDNFEAVTYGEGEVRYPAVTLGKTVVYVWEARAASRESVRGTVAALRRGFALSLDEPGVMTITPYAAPGGVVWTLRGRVTQLTRDPVFTYRPTLRAPFRWGGTLSIHMFDPRFYQGATGYL